jgi:hypothetical protein
MADETEGQNKVVSIFPTAVAPDVDIDPEVLKMAEELLEHVKGNFKVRGVAWVVVGEGGHCVTGRYFGGLWGAPLVGGIEWVKHRCLQYMENGDG